MVEARDVARDTLLEERFSLPLLRLGDGFSRREGFALIDGIADADLESS